MKGGVGKTTMATNICDCLAKREGKKVLLVDIDPQFNATQCLMEDKKYEDYLRKNGTTIKDVFDGDRVTTSTVEGIHTEKKKKMEDVIPVKIKDNYFLLPGNLMLYAIDFPESEGKVNLLKKYIKLYAVPENYDYVIIDTPPTPSVYMTAALIASDYYLVPVKPDPLSLTGIDLLQGIINKRKNTFDLNLECVGLVLTMIERSDSVVFRKAIEYLDSKAWVKYRYRYSLPKRVDLAKFQIGEMILDLNDSNLSLALVHIVDEMIARIEKYEKKSR